MRKEYKAQAIALRKKGKTYSEILAKIPIAKSTLSEWLKSVELATPQKQRITKKKLAAALRGAQTRRKMRLAEVSRLSEQGRKEIAKISHRDLLLIGTALYWAEGSKQNTRFLSTGIIFGNSDYRMLSVFLSWLRSLGIKSDEILFSLYVHVDRKDEIVAFKDWWTNKLNIRKNKISGVYLKKGNPKTRRTNVGDLYHGLLRIRVKSSTALNRRVSGWIDGIVASVGSGVTGNTSAFEAEDSRIVP